MSDIDSGQTFHPGEEFWGQPKGLYICFFTEMWERFSFYGMKALLFLYLIKYHMFGDAPAASYGDLFMLMFWIGIIAAVVAFALVPLVRKGMHGVK